VPPFVHQENLYLVEDTDPSYKEGTISLPLHTQWKVAIFSWSSQWDRPEPI